MGSMKNKVEIMSPHISDLSEKKSDRTTLKLTLESVENLEWLQKQYNLTSKDVFDYLCSYMLAEDNDLLKDCIKRTLKDEQSKTKIPSVRKTYALSRGSIRVLTDVSKKNEISRDLFVSNLISAFKDMVKIQLEEEQYKNKQVIEIVNNFFKEGKTVEERLKNVIPGTSTLEQFRKILALTERLVKKIDL